jgi:hypothetical protein
MLALIASVLLSSAPSVAATARASSSPPPIDSERADASGFILDPYTRESPDGRYVLSVEPTTRNGEGPARYRLLRDGKELWARDEPITLNGAALGDDGVIAGYAYTRGYSYRSASGEFCIAISRADGVDLAVVSKEEHNRTGYFSRDPFPAGRGVFIDGDNGLVLVRCRDPQVGPQEAFGETWRTFRVATREALGVVEPEITASLGARVLDDVRHVRGTPFQLVQWRASERDIRFTLLDRAGRVALHVDPGFDRVVGELDLDARLDWIHTKRGIRGTPVPRRFEIASFAHHALATFEVIPPNADVARWSVREIARIRDEVPAAPRVETIVLERGEPIDLVSTGLTTVSDIAAGLAGRIVVSDAKTRALHVFDERGRALHVIPAPEDAEERVRFVTTPEGGVWMALRGPKEPETTWAVYDARGARAGSAQLSTRRMHSDCAFLADGRAWTRPGDRGDFVLRAVDGSLGRKIDRRADGRWLRNDAVLHVAPDGSVCLSDATQVIADRHVCVSFYTREGEPLRTFEAWDDVPIAAFSRGWTLAYTGRWLIGVNEMNESGRITLFDPRTGVTRSAELGLPESSREDLLRVFSSPDGREAWVFERPALRMHRYVLPAD